MNPSPSSRMARAQCISIGSALPERRLSNQDLEGMVDTSDEWIVSRTGIKERRVVAAGQTLSDLAVAAAQDCLKKAGVSAAELDGIVLATTTGDQTMPASANLVQHRIGATKAWGFDLVNACNGFVAGIATASSFIEAGRAQYVLLIAGDVMTPFIDFEDRNTCILFGDGCGAVLLRAGPADGPGVMEHYMGSDGQFGDLLCIPASGSAKPPSEAVLENKDQYLKQDGRRVFAHAVRRMAEACESLMQQAQITPEDIDLLVPHQANIRIMDSVVRRLNVDREKMMVNIDRLGNTTAGTVPLALADAEAQGRLQAGSRILVTTFGAGFAWGACYLVWGA